jgi:hypothetical protein
MDQKALDLLEKAAKTGMHAYLKNNADGTTFVLVRRAKSCAKLCK